MRSKIWLLGLTAATQSAFVRAQLTPQNAFNPPSPSEGTSSAASSTPNQDWSELLGNVLWFYDAQRAGKLGEAGGATYGNRVSWRNDSVLDDGSDVNLDLSGGFFDAGDYLKLNFPLFFTLANIAWGGIDFGRGYELANQAAYLDSTLRWGYDFLIKCHPQPQTLYVQIGTDEVDNNYWGGDQNIPKPRTSFNIDADHSGTDAAAGAAAAFAAGSALYQGQASLANPAWSSTALQNTTYAQTLVTHAQDLYAFARNTTQQVYQKSVPAANDVYASSGYQDDLVWAALWLYVATNNTAYLDEANSMYNQFSSSLKGSNSVLNWDSVTPAIPILFAQIYSSRASGDVDPWKSESERYFDRILNDPNGKTTDSNGIKSFLTPGGLLYYPSDSSEASLNPSLNAAAMMYRYHSIATTTSKGGQYVDFANGQVDYALGKNPMNVPYVVGAHKNSPSNPHSAAASGGSDINNIDTSPVDTRYVLYGAVVGGPDVKDRFFNIRSDWPETEIALDYNQPILNVVAYNVINNPSSPYYATLTADAVHPPGKPDDAANDGGGGAGGGGGLSGGAKGAIAAVVIVLVLAAAGLVWWFFFRQKKHFKR